MRRTSFDEYRDQKVADDFLGERAPCMFCGAMTERATLSEYGARCGPCFTQYVTGGKPNPPMPSLEKRQAALLRLKGLTSNNNPKAWIGRLKARRDAGEALNAAQKAALKAVGEQA